jgi:hypothetical protein
MSYAQTVDQSLLAGEGNAPVKSDGLYIRFYREPVLNELKSFGGTVVKANGATEYVEGEGRPIYEDQEYIEIVTPGDKTNVVNRPVRPADKKQYAQQYAAWKAGDEEQLTGTPLAMWPGISRAQVEELKFFKVRTVEQLAELSDANLQNVGPLRQLRERAKDFLDAAKGHAPTESLRAQLAEEKNRREALERQVQELVAAQAKQGKQKSA